VLNIVTDLNNVGIPALANFQSGYTPYYTALLAGDYTAAISWTNSGPTPYYEYQAMLSTAYSAPAGSPTSGTNRMRWDATTGGTYAAQVDADLVKYQSSTDQATQMAAMQDIETVMATQMPAIPLTVNVFWDEYTTTHWTGWPTAANPYNTGAPYQAPGYEDVVLHLTPA
jgi:peptide/nickel transport system substrate-binding protein